MSDRGGSRRGMAFGYQAPTYENAVKLSERRGRGFDSMFVDGIKFFKARAGDNEIRILPPTWVGHKHYAFEIRVHRDIGPDNQQYLCLNQEGSPERGHCPICAERAELVHSARTQTEKEEVDKMRATSSGVIFLIDRVKQRDQDDGPVIWQISTRTDNEILSQSLIKSSQMYLPIVHPTEGYDVEFARSGEGLMTRYRGFRVARSPSPVSNDPDQLQRWMDYLDDHPIPEILNYYSEEHIRTVWRGQSSRRQESDAEERRANDRQESPPWEGQDEIRRGQERDVPPRDDAAERPRETPRAAPEEPRRARVGASLSDRVRQRLNEV
jgi:hypothetical protein